MEKFDLILSIGGIILGLLASISGSIFISALYSWPEKIKIEGKRLNSSAISMVLHGIILIIFTLYVAYLIFIVNPNLILWGMGILFGILGGLHANMFVTSFSRWYGTYGKEGRKLNSDAWIILISGSILTIIILSLLWTFFSIQSI